MTFTTTEDRDKFIAFGPIWVFNQCCSITKYEDCPHIFACQNCGSFAHKLCDTPACLKCRGKDHTTNTHPCHGMTSLFPFSSLSSSLPSSIHLQPHPTTSACLPPCLCQLQGILVQLCYIHCWTSLRLTSDLLRSGSHAKEYHLYTLV